MDIREDMLPVLGPKGGEEEVQAVRSFAAQATMHWADCQAKKGLIAMTKREAERGQP